MATSECVEYRFDKTTYHRLCTRVTGGSVPQLKLIFEALTEEERRRFGPGTLCPDSSYKLSSPLVNAAHHGQLEVVKYLLENFRGSIDVNKGSKVTTKQYLEAMYDVPPLVAACTNDNLELVQYLVSNGADIHRLASQWGTPLCIAARYGCMAIAKYLLDNGADINAANKYGVTAFLMASGVKKSSTNVEMLNLLIARGADMYCKANNGDTAHHLAAINGNVEVMKCLITNGFIPSYSPADPTSEEYRPCPLYIAADLGNQEIVDILTDLPQCPPICKGEAYLLRSIHYNQIEKELLQKALTIIESSPIKPVYPPPVAEYGYCKEISSVAEFINSNPLNRLDILHQSLLIRERCLGQLHLRFIVLLPRKGLTLWTQGFQKEAEWLFHRAVVVSKQLLFQMEKQPHLYNIDEVLMSVYRILARITVYLRRVFEAKYDVDYEFYTEFALVTAGVIKQMRDSTKVDRGTMIDFRLLKFFAYWFTSCCQKDMQPPEKFNLLLKELISRFLYQPNGSTLLHLLLTKSIFLHIIVKRNLFLRTILSLGGDDAILHPDGTDKGRRPLHIAANLNLTDGVVFTNTLILHGAHIDAVDVNGKTPLDYCDRDSPIYSFLLSTGPLPLSCQAARMIISENIPYQLIDLPKHIIQFIQLHDPKSINIENGYFYQ